MFPSKQEIVAPYDQKRPSMDLGLLDHMPILLTITVPEIVFHRWHVAQEMLHL
jgi:hypothetical protein